MNEEEELDKFEQLLLKDLEEDDEVKEKAISPNDTVTEKKTEKKTGEKQMSRLDAMRNFKKETEEAQENSGGGSNTFFKPTVGKNRIRLLPGEFDKGLPFVQYFQNYIDGKFIVVQSADNPLSRKGWELHNEYKDTDPDAAKAARAKWLSSKTIAVNIVQVGEEDATPKIWVTSEKRIFEIIELIEDYGDFWDVDGGRDLILTRKGTGQGTKYSLVPAPEPSALENADEILEQMEDLDDWLANQIVKTSELEKIVEANA